MRRCRCKRRRKKDETRELRCACERERKCLCGRGWNEAPAPRADHLATRLKDQIHRYEKFHGQQVDARHFANAVLRSGWYPYCIDKEICHVIMSGSQRTRARCIHCRQYFQNCRCDKGWKIETRAEKKRYRDEYEDYMYALSATCLEVDSLEHDVYKKKGLGTCRSTMEKYSDIVKRMEKKFGKSSKMKEINV